MELTDKYWLSEYQDLGELNGNENVHIVRNNLSGSICVKKYVALEMEGIYQFLKNHPNPYIPRIYHCIQDVQYLIVIEEYLKGKNLEGILTERLRREDEAADIIICLCKAMELLHNADPPIICRDLKAENVMITQEGAVKLVDFDIARVYQHGKNRDTMMMGTEHYAAPEQFGFAQTDARTDIYAMGVLLNYLLTGRYPIEYTVAGNMGRIVRKCTALKPEERYQTVMELREALKEYLNLANADICQNILPKVSYQKMDGMADRKAGGSFAIPGFRSKKVWKMCAAVLGYIMITWACFTMDFQSNNQNMTFPKLQMKQLFVWLAQIATVFYIYNYLDIQNKWKLPMIHKQRRSQRICGYILAWFIFLLIAAVICAVLETIFFS